MVVYADTSFIVSLYGRDAHSPVAQAAVKKSASHLLFTPLHGLECRNALRLAVFRREITRDQCRDVLSLLEQDNRSGVLVNTVVPWSSVFAHAERLSADYAATMGLRSLDILHVASALALDAKRFWTFDARQKALSRKAGLKVALL